MNIELGENMNGKGRLSEEEISDMPLGSLITTVSRGHLIFLFQEIEKHGITGGQYQFLTGLSREDGISQEELANNFHMNESTIARALRKLEDTGMVQREVDDNNRRRKIITITEKGKNTVDSIRKVDENWEKQIQSLSAKEKYRLKQMLKRLLTETMNFMNKEKE